MSPDLADFRAFDELGCPLIRIMGSPIGSLRGVAEEWRPTIEQILAQRRTRVMLDGGIGTYEQAVDTLALGFDCVLVNSCLFGDAVNPAEKLAGFREYLLQARRPESIAS